MGFVIHHKSLSTVLSAESMAETPQNAPLNTLVQRPEKITICARHEAVHYGHGVGGGYQKTT